MRFSVVVVTLTALLVAVSAQDYCDQLRCENGGQPNCDDPKKPFCDCLEGWEGQNCQLCQSNDACEAQRDTGENICDTSLPTYEEKYTLCDVTDAFFSKYVKSISAECFFDESEIDDPFHKVEYCSITAYEPSRYRYPWLFRCDYKQCEKNFDGPTSLRYHCTQSNCYVNEDVENINKAVKAYADGVKGDTDLTCDETTGRCVLSMDPVRIPLTGENCRASVCVKDLPPPIPEPLNPLVFMGAAGAILTAFVGYTIYFVRRDAANSLLKEHNAMHVTRANLTFDNISYSLFIEGKNKSRTTVWSYLTACWSAVYSCRLFCWWRSDYKPVEKPPPEETQILHGVSGVVKSGQLLAIMGASGAGKTSLLDIIANRKTVGKVGGSIRVNGAPVDPESYRRVSGYVLQELALMPTLTVREALKFSALLRLPSHLPLAKKIGRVEQVIEELGLVNVANSRIGNADNRGISGGERRRVAIGIELVTNPSILFLDEPTSGLDASNALAVMKCLRNMASAGRTIVFSIHQPRSNIFELFDQLLLLTGGKTAYYGPAAGAVGHFASLGHLCPANYNPADYVIDVVSSPARGVIKGVVDGYAKSPAAAAVQADIASESSKPEHRPFDSKKIPPYATDWVRQFIILTRRTVINVWRNPFLLKTHFAITVAIAIGLGLIYHPLTADLAGVQNRLGLMFFLCAVFSFGSLTSLELFIAERNIFITERANGVYRPTVYYMTKALFDILPLRVVPPLLLAAIVYPMTGLNKDTASRPARFAEALVLVNVNAAAFCLALGTVTASFAVANLVAVLAMLFFLLFGGFMVNNVTLPWYARPLRDASFAHYGMEALAVNEMDGLSVNFNPPGYEPLYVDAVIFLKSFGMDVYSLKADLRALWISAGIYFLLAYIGVMFFMRERR